MNFKLIKDFDETYDKCFICGKQMQLFFRLSIDRNYYPPYGKKVPYKSYNVVSESILLSIDNNLIKPFKPKNGNVKYNFAININDNKILSNTEFFNHVFNYKLNVSTGYIVYKKCKTDYNSVYCSVDDADVLTKGFFPSLKGKSHVSEFCFNNSEKLYLSHDIDKKVTNFRYGKNFSSINNSALDLSKIKTKKELFNKIETIKIFM